MAGDPFTPFLQMAAEGRPLPDGAMEGAMELLLSGSVSDNAAAGFLMALRVRGETTDEIAAAARAMRARAIRVDARGDVVDTCGTGGDGAGTLNISTAAAIVASAAGVPIAKHGNRAASSLSGSSDVLQVLGVNLQAEKSVIERCLSEAGIGFLFAAYHHQAVANVARVRKALGVRTLFNLLGPLTNPAGARRQLLGVFSADLLEPMARTLRLLGAERAWIVHGSDGLDELTITGPSHVCAFDGDRFERFEVTPQMAGLSVRRAEEIAGGTPQDNARAFTDLLAGNPSAYRDITILNAAAALVIGGRADDLAEGARLAAAAIDGGHAQEKLAALVRLSNAEEIHDRT